MGHVARVAAVIAWAGLSGPAWAQPAEAPLLSIIESSGAVDGPLGGHSDRPSWERVRLEVRVQNRLRQRVTDLEIELALLSAVGRPASAPIPGWTFREVVADTSLAPEAVTDLIIERELPARRSSPPADEIAYRVRILGYRIRPPDLATAVELLGSPRRSDQRAARLSFDAAARAALPADALAGLRAEIAAQLRNARGAPSASDALRMLLAIRAVGSLGLPGLIPNLLALPERVDRPRWAGAVIELGRRMGEASEAEDPRLEILPAWAREPTALLTVRAQDALDDAVRDSILSMGDLAVPALILESHRRERPAARRRARRLLVGLGRVTVGAQLQVRDTGIKAQVIRAFGTVGRPGPMTALIDVLRGNDEVLKLEARRAIESIGPAALPALMDALGEAEDAEVYAQLSRLLRTHPRAVAQALGTTPAKAAANLRTLRAERRRKRRAALERQVQQALATGRSDQRFRAAFRALDRVFDEDSELYMKHAPEIAALYRDQARRLYDQGNFDAAVRTAKTGLAVFKNPETLDVLADAQIALVLGFLQLGDLQQADEVLAAVPAGHRQAQRDQAQGELWTAKARRAVDIGRYDLARALVDRTRALRPDIDGLDTLDRRLRIVENYAVLGVLALMVPAGILALVLFIRGRWLRRRLLRSAALLDKADEKVDPAANNY